MSRDSRVDNVRLFSGFVVLLAVIGTIAVTSPTSPGLWGVAAALAALLVVAGLIAKRGSGK